MAQHADQLLDDRGLDAFRRLVEEDQLRLAGEAARDGQELLLATAQRAAPAVEQGREAREGRQDRVDALLGAAAGEAHPQIVANAEAGEDLAPLRHVAEAAPRARV